MINVSINFQGNTFYLQLKPDDNIKTLIEEAKIRAGYGNIGKLDSGHYIKTSGKLFVIMNSQVVEDENKTISELNIRNNYTLLIYDPERIIGAGPIDNLNNENAENLGFNLNLINRNELFINLIYFDLNMRNEENYDYYINFKIDVVGGFYAIDNLDILKKYLDTIKLKNIPFLVISSGSSGKEVINLTLNYSFVKEVIIFCYNYEYNKHYLEEYPGYVKKVFTNKESLYNYIKQFYFSNSENEKENYFSEEQIKMDKQIDQCPLIVSKEYDECYFLVHRAYSHFFGNMLNDDNPFYDQKGLNFTRILDFCFEYIHNNDMKLNYMILLLIYEDLETIIFLLKKQLEHIQVKALFVTYLTEL